MAIKFYTIATHSPSGFERLVQSAGFYGIDLTVLGVFAQNGPRFVNQKSRTFAQALALA